MSLNRTQQLGITPLHSPAGVRWKEATQREKNSSLILCEQQRGGITLSAHGPLGCESAVRTDRRWGKSCLMRAKRRGEGSERETELKWIKPVCPKSFVSCHLPGVTFTAAFCVPGDLARGPLQSQHGASCLLGIFLSS